MKLRILFYRALAIWGAFSLLVIIAFVGNIVYVSYFNGNEPEINRATPKDVRYVLNLCELGDSRIESVVHSYVSSRDLAGDHLDVFAIKITHLELSELTQTKSGRGQRWYRGDEIPTVVNDTYNFMGSWLHEFKWFPAISELRTAEYYVYPSSIYFDGVRPTAAKLIIVRPSDKMVFFFGAKE